MLVSRPKHRHRHTSWRRERGCGLLWRLSSLFFPRSLVSPRSLTQDLTASLFSLSLHDSGLSSLSSLSLSHPLPASLSCCSRFWQQLTGASESCLTHYQEFRVTNLCHQAFIKKQHIALLHLFPSFFPSPPCLIISGILVHLSLPSSDSR